MQDVAGLLIFLFLVVANFGLMAALAGAFVRPRPARAKGEPFECGVVPRSPLPGRLNVSFYAAGLLLLVFDVLAAVLLPWAAVFRTLGAPGLAAMGAFAGFLLAGYAFALGRGMLRW